jgi:hypothetical protein
VIGCKEMGDKRQSRWKMMGDGVNHEVEEWVVCGMGKWHRRLDEEWLKCMENGMDDKMGDGMGGR